jgi:hypothetical protein
MSTAEQRTLTALLTAVTLTAVVLLALLGGPTGGAFVVRSTALAAATDNHLRALARPCPSATRSAPACSPPSTPAGSAWSPPTSACISTAAACAGRRASGSSSA